MASDRFNRRRRAAGRDSEDGKYGEQVQTAASRGHHHLNPINFAITIAVIFLSGREVSAVSPCLVTSYGAVGDNRTEDTAAVGAALLACGGYGAARPIVFPAPGVYYIRPLIIPSATELIIEEGEAGADAEGLEIGVMQKWRHHETLAEVVLHLPRAMNVFERFVEAEGMDRVATAVENYPRHMVLRRHAQDIQAGLKRQWGRTEWQWAKSGVMSRLKDVAAAAALEPAE